MALKFDPTMPTVVPPINVSSGVMLALSFPVSTGIALPILALRCTTSVASRIAANIGGPCSACTLFVINFCSSSRPSTEIPII